MSKQFRPMLAVDIGDTKELRYPLYATPKMDGIRCLTMPWEIEGGKCVPVTRSLDRIKNDLVFCQLAKWLPPHLDGELLAGDFHTTQSEIMRSWGFPSFKYVVFDCFMNPTKTYLDRLKDLDWLIKRLDLPEWFSVVLPLEIPDEETMWKELEKRLEEGYEGLILRSAFGPYKYGRSTLKQGWMLKLKLFRDAEAKIIGFKELEHNRNAAKVNELGYLERSHLRSNMILGETLGSLVVENIEDKTQFSIGSGFTATDRQEIWDNRDVLLGKIVKYKWQYHGSKDKPRFPIFVGFRDESDL